MNEKSFGELLKLLLETADEKSIVLARNLRYDTSYLSKWLNDSRLPSRKNREQLVEDLCNFFITPASPALLEKFATILDLKVQPWEMSDLRHLLWEYLSMQLKESLGMNEHSSEVLSELPNSMLLLDRDQANTLVEDAIRLYCKSSPENDIHFITTHPPSRYLIKNSIDDLRKKTQSIYENKALHLSQFFECSDVSNNSDYCKIILLHIHHSPRVRYKLYVGKSLDNIRIMVIKNCLCSIEFYDNILRRPYRCITKVPEIANDVFAQYQRFLDTQTPVFEHFNLLKLSSQHYFSNFIMQQNFCCLMETMQFFLLPQDIMKKQPIYKTISEDIRIFLEMLNSPSLHGNIRLMIYKSALMDYILRGTARLLGELITVSKQDRILHLENLICRLQDNSGLEIRLLEDQHPTISRSDLGCSLYINGISMFAIKEPDNEAESRCYLFLDSGTISSFEQFYNNIWDDCNDADVSSSSVINFFKKGLTMIVHMGQ